MQERYLPIQTPDGIMETYITCPDGKGPFPGVVIFQNVGGFSDTLRGMGRRVTEAGYYCAVPDLYYRLGRVVLDPDTRDPEVMAIRKIATNSMRYEKGTGKGNTRVMKDSRAVLDFMQKDPLVKPGPKGCIGYCMGGRYSIYAAGEFPEIFRASAALFGTRLITEDPDSPHLMLAKTSGELYCGFAEHDDSMPLPVVAQFEELMKKAGVNGQVEIHMGTEHGYAFPGRKVYHAAAAELSWQRIFAMFERHLPR